jgi:hypothetical protein
VAVAAVAPLIGIVPGAGGDSDETLRWMTLAFLPVLILQPFLRFPIWPTTASG